MLKGQASWPMEETIQAASLITKRVCRTALKKTKALFLVSFSTSIFLKARCVLADRKDKDFKKRSSKKRKVHAFTS